MLRVVPCEAHARARLEALEKETKPIRTFSAATTTLYEWSYRLRVMVIRVLLGKPSHEHGVGLFHRVGRGAQDDGDEGRCDTRQDQGVGSRVLARVLATRAGRRSTWALTSMPEFVGPRRVVRSHAQADAPAAPESREVEAEAAHAGGGRGARDDSADWKRNQGHGEKNDSGETAEVLATRGKRQRWNDGEAQDNKSVHRTDRKGQPTAKSDPQPHPYPSPRALEPRS